MLKQQLVTQQIQLKSGGNATKQIVDAVTSKKNFVKQ